MLNPAILVGGACLALWIGRFARKLMEGTSVVRKQFAGAEGEDKENISADQNDVTGDALSARSPT